MFPPCRERDRGAWGGSALNVGQSFSRALSGRRNVPEGEMVHFEAAPSLRSGCKPRWRWSCCCLARREIGGSRKAAAAARNLDHAAEGTIDILPPEHLNTRVAKGEIDAEVDLAPPSSTVLESQVLSRSRSGPSMYWTLMWLVLLLTPRRISSDRLETYQPSAIISLSYPT